MDTKEFPEEDEILFGTVNKIVGTSVFVKLDNYGKEGVVSFSEVAPGRIRNIRDYVRIGQKIVCKVLRLDRAKGHIDLSLRRVTSKEKKEITQEYKREKEFSVVLNLIVKDKTRVSKVVEELKKKIRFSELLHKIIYSPNEIKGLLTEAKLNEEEIRKLTELVSEKLREKKIIVKAKIILSSEAADGIEKIKEALINLENKGAEVSYMGAPNYMISIESTNYKEANKKLHTLLEEMVLKAKEKNYKVEIKEK
ncbi:MAG: S1 RNA-binding domain-containing protein [Candidatus Pacearchaeota archaeon]